MSDKEATSGARGRDQSVDLLRGVAIAFMVWGHLGVAIYGPGGVGKPSETLQGTPPLWAEGIGGVAPTLFILLSGMMIAYGRDRGLRVQLERMLMLLVAGAALDVLFWHILPFTSVDVLYLIGISLPLAYLFATKLPARLRWPLALGILLLTPLLQQWLGYSDYPSEYSFWRKLYRKVPNQTNIAQHWLLDGWFPIFPWLGVSFVGVLLGERRKRQPAGAPDRALLAAGVALLALGIAAGYPWASPRLVIRMEAGGAFMPPDLGYLSASIGATLLLLWLADQLPASKALIPLLLLGQGSLLVYVLHFPMIRGAISVVTTRLDGWRHTGVTLAVLLGFAATVHLRGRLLPSFDKR